jgi:hypothetical protein
MYSFSDHTYTHVISAADIWLEAHQISAALTAGDYNTEDLDFEMLAVQAKVREVRETIRYHSVAVEELRWAEPDYHGDVEVQITVQAHRDLLMLHMALFTGS